MPRFHAAIAAAVCAAGLAFAHPAGAGADIYDMSGLLAEPHPFAVPAPPPRAPRAPGRGASGPVYDMAPAPGAPHPFDVAAPRPPAAGPTATAPMRRAPPPAPDGPAHGRAYVEFGLGYYDIDDNEDAAEFRVEWRGRDFWWKLKPLAGVMATSDAAAYLYGGLAADFGLGRRLVLTPSFAAGLYSDGSGKDLGSAIEFRSGLGLAWRFDSGARLGAMIYHISNANISDNNPGTEVLSLGYAIPLD